MTRLLPPTIKTKVAGTSFVPDIERTLIDLELALSVHDCEPDVTLTRDPANPHDSNAVQVWVTNRHPGHHHEPRMIGHLPATVAARIAPELDNGRPWRARIEWVGGAVFGGNMGIRLILEAPRTCPICHTHGLPPCCDT